MLLAHQSLQVMQLSSMSGESLDSLHTSACAAWPHQHVGLSLELHNSVRMMQLKHVHVASCLHDMYTYSLMQLHSRIWSVQDLSSYGQRELFEAWSHQHVTHAWPLVSLNSLLVTAEAWPHQQAGHSLQVLVRLESSSHKHVSPCEIHQPLESSGFHRVEAWPHQQVGYVLPRLRLCPLSHTHVSLYGIYQDSGIRHSISHHRSYLHSSACPGASQVPSCMLARARTYQHVRLLRPCLLQLQKSACLTEHGQSLSESHAALTSLPLTSGSHQSDATACKFRTFSFCPFWLQFWTCIFLAAPFDRGKSLLFFGAFLSGFRALPLTSSLGAARTLLLLLPSYSSLCALCVARESLGEARLTPSRAPRAIHPARGQRIGEAALCFSLAFFCPPPFSIALSLSLSSSFLSSFSCLSFLLSFASLFLSLSFLFFLLCFCFMERTTSKYSITKVSFINLFSFWCHVLFSL